MSAISLLPRNPKPLVLQFASDWPELCIVSTIHVWLCMYVCMYVLLCMYVCMYVCMYCYVCMYACIYVCIAMYMCMHVFMYVCIYISMAMYVCMSYLIPSTYLAFQHQPPFRTMGQGLLKQKTTWGICQFNSLSMQLNSNFTTIKQLICKGVKFEKLQQESYGGNLKVDEVGK